MDYAINKKVINESTRVNLLGNSLVLIAPKDSKIDKVDIRPGFDLAKLAGDGRIATGDVNSVPVGKYAKMALEKLGVWQAVEPKFAMAENVRAALILVARGEAALGIVYSTDAKIEPGVRIVGTFPADSHPAIIYPVAATVSAKPETNDYLAFLRSTTAQTIFEKYGFQVLGKPLQVSEPGAYDARSSFSFASMKSTSSGLVPGPPAKWPQIEGTGTRLAFGMCATSNSLSSGGKYRSVWPGMT